MQTTKQIKAILLALAMALSLFAVSTMPARAASSGAIIDVGDSTTTSGINWTYKPYTQVFIVTGDVTVTGSTSVNRIRVHGTANITLADVSIDVSALSECAFDMIGAHVFLILAGTNVLKSGDSKAGLAVPVTSGSRLTIDGTGSLTVIGGTNSAGIGGDQGGTITINGGAINAIGGVRGAGIGGGHGGWGGVITINGGAVNATGGERGAGIGGGAGGAGGAITVGGGVINARGGVFGAGIGGGAGGAGGATIGGNAQVTAIGGGGDGVIGGAGIGSGGSEDERYAGSGSAVTIVGSPHVTAVGGSGAVGGAGIGSGGSARKDAPPASGSVKISTTGTVVATGGTGMNGQGGRYNGANIGEGGYRSGSGKAMEPRRFVTPARVIVTQTAGGTITPLGGSMDTAPDKHIRRQRHAAHGRNNSTETVSDKTNETLNQPQHAPASRETTSGALRAQRQRVSEAIAVESGEKVFFFGPDPDDGSIAVTVPEGASKTFAFTPDPGYAIVAVVINGQKIGPLERPFGSWTLDRISGGSRAISAIFAPQPISLGATIDVGDSVTTSGAGWTYDPETHVFTVTGDVTITGTTKRNTIRVAGDGAPKNIALSDITIDVEERPFDMSGATVFLTLIGTNTLESRNYTSLHVPDGSILTIDGTGSLTAASNSFGAGIGSSPFYHSNNWHYPACGTITINGGTIIAKGGNSYGAGIGSILDSASGNITINGGTVDAIGGHGGAGIGGGGKYSKSKNLDGGNITISGGTVTASGRRIGGVGIGGDGAGGNIVISGGNVTANGAENGGAGIGSRERYENSSNITITGDANVTATGGNGTDTDFVIIPYTVIPYYYTGIGGGAGIGSGGTGKLMSLAAGKITIDTTGTVNAIGGTSMCGLISVRCDGAAIGRGGHSGGTGQAVKPSKSVTTHRVTVTQTIGGAITPLGGTADAVPHGANKTFTITPKPGYAIASVTVNGTDVGAVRSWTLVNVSDDSRAITARFVLKDASAKNAER